MRRGPKRAVPAASAGTQLLFDLDEPKRKRLNHMTRKARARRGWRRYYHRNRRAMMLRARAYYEKNRERVILRMREYRRRRRTG